MSVVNASTLEPSTIKAAIRDLFDPRITVAEAADRHFALGFRQRTNGAWEERSAVLSRVRELRAAVERVEIMVLDELSDGHRYAERHIVELRRRTGPPLRLEVYVFAERDSAGRFVKIEESNFSLESEARDGTEQVDARMRARKWSASSQRKGKANGRYSQGKERSRCRRRVGDGPRNRAIGGSRRSKGHNFGPQS